MKNKGRRKKESKKDGQEKVGKEKGITRSNERKRNK